MSKPLYLTIAACLGLVGCQVFEKSSAWQLATDVRPGESVRAADPSGSYAAKLHSALAGEGIEHKVVTYQYQYYNRFHEEVLGTRTAVVYRDNSSGAQPWWLKDDRLNTPFWLPNGSLDQQISFYVRRKAKVIEVQEYPGSGSGKAQVALRNAGPAPKVAAQSRPLFKPATSAPRTEPIVTQTQPAPKKVVVFKAPLPQLTPAPKRVVSRQEKAVTTIQPAKKASAPPVVVATRPSRLAPVARGPVETSIVRQTEPTRPFTVRKVAPPKPAASEPALDAQDTLLSEPIPATHPSSSINSVSPASEHDATAFRKLHGTEFNSGSGIDRKKMWLIQQASRAQDARAGLPALTLQ